MAEIRNLRIVLAALILSVLASSPEARTITLAGKLK
jgi:hypothetical protein